MSKPQTVDIHILDKEYQVSCPPEERDALMQAARQLDERMRTIRSSGSVIGLERIAVMAALNLTYDLAKAESSAASSAGADEDIQRLDNKISQALQGLEQTSIF